MNGRGRDALNRVSLPQELRFCAQKLLVSCAFSLIKQSIPSSRRLMDGELARDVKKLSTVVRESFPPRKRSQKSILKATQFPPSRK